MGFFLMTTLTFLYDDYIDRPKLSEQKNPFEYIVPHPLDWVGKLRCKSSPCTKNNVNKLYYTYTHVYIYIENFSETSMSIYTHPKNKYQRVSSELFNSKLSK